MRVAVRMLNEHHRLTQVLSSLVLVLWLDDLLDEVIQMIGASTLLFCYVLDYLVRGAGKGMNSNNVALMEPKLNRSIKLPAGRVKLGYLYRCHRTRSTVVPALCFRQLGEGSR